MEESDVRHDIYIALQKYGYWPVHGRDVIICPRCNNRLYPKLGRPDLLILDPLDCTKVCEVKAIYLDRELSFAFSKIEPEQRRWLDAWVSVHGEAYLGIGTIEPKRSIWVIPWEDYRVTEDRLIAEGYTNIPVSLQNYKKINKTVPNTSIALEFDGYEMYRDKAPDGKYYWRFNDSHPLSWRKENSIWITSQSQDGQ